MSQPRSPLDRAQQSPTASPSQLSNASQSRIPRLRTSSRLSVGKPDARARRSSAPLKEMKKLPLSEKTSSTLNSFNSRSRLDGSPKVSISSETSTTGPKQRGTKESIRSAPQDTVQHKPSQPSPLKAQANNGTPDWKRRLKSNTGSGDQQDLFSPIGLESVFKPPTVKAKGQTRKGPRYQPAVTDIPSSPPQVPAKTHEASTKMMKEDSIDRADSTKNRVALNDTSQRRESESNTSRDRPDEQDIDPHRAGEGLLQEAVQPQPDQTKKLAITSQPSRMRPRLPSYDQRSLSKVQGTQTSDDRKGSWVGSDYCALSERSRVSSGQTEDRNEDFTPFFVSRQHTVDGRVDYTPMVDMNRARQSMDDIRLQQQRRRPSSRSSDHCVDHNQAHSPTHSLEPPIPDSDATSLSLPEDLSIGSEPFKANGRYINLRRGGRSQEGSFLRRPLSPTSPSSSQLADSQGTSSRRPSMNKVHMDKGEILREPTTPKRLKQYDANSSERPRSSGSPLKLFDKYDTFTNDRLQRRMSKFEETVPDQEDQDNASDKDAAVDEQVYQNKEGAPSSNSPKQRSSSRISSFGDGELDDHVFESFPSPPSQHHSDELRETPYRMNPKPGDFRFVQATEEEAIENTASQSTRVKPTANVIQLSNAREAAPNQGEVEENVIRMVNGKRLPYSPAKDPRPKRRRTLRSSEEAKLESVRDRHDSISTGPPTSSVLGRKRKDALYENSVQVADPKVLAMRQILRPRNPTPSQSASQRPQHAADIDGTVDEEAYTQPATQRLAGKLAHFALDKAQELTGSARKPSVNTADFFNEAQHIMQLIRSRGRPVSEDIAEEDCAADPEGPYTDTYYPESTKEELSRPPSREGGSLRRQRQPAKLDARVVSQLRKFEEKTDVGMTLSSSIKSLKMGQPNDTAMTIELKDLARQQDEEMESDLNIRIIERKGHHSSAETVVPALTSDMQNRSTGSNSTSGPSTNQSIPTNSSRSSRNKAVIAPETVAHLLSDQVAGMKFDHQRQVWVKSRESSGANGDNQHGISDNEITDDELGAIPDLSVDEIEELRRIKLAGSPQKRMASVSDRVAHFDHATSNHQNLTGVEAPVQSSSRPHTADGTQANTNDINSAPSKFSRFASSGPVPETRATSWGGEAFGRKEQSHAQGAEEVEHEISILDGRVSITPGRSNHRQPRAVTVTFSSPLVDHIEASYFHDEHSALQDDGSDLELEESPARKVNHKRTTPVMRRASSGLGRRSAYRSSSRRVSIGNQSYIARPMSRLDEQDEMSMIHLPNGQLLDVALSTPLPSTHSALAVPPSGQASSSVTFQLSPLPDFSVHQTDRLLDNFSAVQPLHPKSLQQGEKRISQATQEMVKKITDVEPYEPHWDYLQALDLHDRNIASLHMLNEFCGRLEKLDVSNNQLRDLTGAPYTLRCLRMRQNCLSNLTAWNHLPNLQYVDISGNQLQDLHGFRNLVHLRELRADENQIQNIDGILGLDGLIRLSLRGNQLETVDLEDSEL